MLEVTTEKDLNVKKNFSNFVLLHKPKVPYFNLEAHHLWFYSLRFLNQYFMLISPFSIIYGH
jgi:hypothetical protein